MASLSTQFFATVDELGALASGWLAVEGLHAVAVEYFPFVVVPTTHGDVEAHVRRQRVAQLVFAERPIDGSATTQGQLLDRNEGSFILDIGRLGPAGLDESSISTLDVSRRWRSLANNLKKRTTAGMVGIDDRTGATARYRDLRYTHGAAALEAAGIALRQYQQTPARFRPAPRVP